MLFQKEVFPVNSYVIFWAAALLFAIIAEVGTAALVSVWFMPGIIASLVLAILKVDLWIQIVVFFALSAVCVFLGFKFFRKRMFRNPKTRMNAEGLVGELGVVTEAIENTRSLSQSRIFPSSPARTAANTSKSFSIARRICTP